MFSMLTIDWVKSVSAVSVLVKHVIFLVGYKSPIFSGWNPICFFTKGRMHGKQQRHRCHPGRKTMKTSWENDGTGGGTWMIYGPWENDGKAGLERRFDFFKNHRNMMFQSAEKYGWFSWVKIHGETGWEVLEILDVWTGQGKWGNMMDTKVIYTVKTQMWWKRYPIQG